MKASRFLLVVLGTAGAGLAPAALAGPRSSASYAVATDSNDSGGRRATSAAYTNDASVGGITGVSTVAAPAEVAKAGYLGQLYEVTGFTVASASPSLGEGTTLQLQGRQVLDDATFLAVPAASVAWSVQSGPLTSISASGLATAGLVYQDTGAVAQGIFGGRTGFLSLTVLNTNNDNFGAYAGDGIDDAWQVQYFGPPPNPLAGPAMDPDGDGQTNLFEYIAGLVPNDPNSRFVSTITPVAGQPNQRNITFSPVVAGRTYTVTSRTDLTTGAWQPLGSFSMIDNGSSRTVTDLNAGAGRRFYHVEITRP